MYTVNRQKKTANPLLSYLRQFLDFASDFFWKVAQMLKFFLEIFFAAPTPPQPTNEFFPKNRNFKKWPFSTFCHKIAPMRCSMWPCTPKFFLQGQVFNFQSTKKIIFLERAFPEHPFWIKNFQSEPIFEISTPKIDGLRVSERAKKNLKSSLWITLRPLKNFGCTTTLKNSLLCMFFQFWAFELLNQNPVRLSQVV